MYVCCISLASFFTVESSCHLFFTSFLMSGGALRGNICLVSKLLVACARSSLAFSSSTLLLPLLCTSTLSTLLLSLPIPGHNRAQTCVTLSILYFFPFRFSLLPFFIAILFRPSTFFTPSLATYSPLTKHSKLAFELNNVHCIITPVCLSYSDFEPIWFP